MIFYLISLSDLIIRQRGLIIEYIFFSEVVTEKICNNFLAECTLENLLFETNSQLFQRLTRFLLPQYRKFSFSRHILVNPFQRQIRECCIVYQAVLRLTKKNMRDNLRIYWNKSSIKWEQENIVSDIYKSLNKDVLVIVKNFYLVNYRHNIMWCTRIFVTKPK